MQESIYLFLGFVVILLVFYDFFYTTLSASGAAFFTKNLSFFLHWILLVFSKTFGRRVLNLSGLLINLPMLIVWLLLFWTGLFLIFSSDPKSIVNDEGKVASGTERFYYTGYVISTLGMGDFKPTSQFFKIITSAFSLFGFIFITTSMSYLISISSAIINKRTISLFVRNIGSNPAELVQFLIKTDATMRQHQFISLQEIIDSHFNNHQTFPVIHYYHTQKKESSLSINLSVLDEALSIILASKDFSEMHSEVRPLRNAISNFLKHIRENYRLKNGPVPQINWEKYQSGKGIGSFSGRVGDDLSERRKTLWHLLNNEDWSWKEVYPDSVIEYCS